MSDERFVAKPMTVRKVVFTETEAPFEALAKFRNEFPGCQFLANTPNNLVFHDLSDPNPTGCTLGELRRGDCIVEHSRNLGEPQRLEVLTAGQFNQWYRPARPEEL